MPTASCRWLGAWCLLCLVVTPEAVPNTGRREGLNPARLSELVVRAKLSETTLVSHGLDGSRQVTKYGVVTLDKEPETVALVSSQTGDGSTKTPLSCGGLKVSDVGSAPQGMLGGNQSDEWSPVMVPAASSHHTGKLGILFLSDGHLRRSAGKLLIDRTSVQGTHLNSTPGLDASLASQRERWLSSCSVSYNHGGGNRTVRFVLSPGRDGACRGGDWRSMIDTAARYAMHVNQLARVRSRSHHEYGMTHPHEMLSSFLTVDERLVSLDGSGRTARSKSYYHDIAESLTIRKKDISQSFARMMCKTGHVRHMTTIHHDIGEHASTFVKDMMGTQVIGVIGSMVKAMIMNPIMGALIGGFVDILMGVFMMAVVGGVTKQIAGPMKMEVSSSLGGVMSALLPNVLAIMLSGSLSVRVSKALVGSVGWQVNKFLDQEASASMSSAIIHQLSHTITNSITTSLNYGLTHSLTHTLSTALSNSVTHYFYCTYCYYFGDYCQYCYYYQDFKWMHKQNWEGIKDAETKEDKDKRIPPPGPGDSDLSMFALGRKAMKDVKSIGKVIGDAIDKTANDIAGIDEDDKQKAEETPGEAEKAAMASIQEQEKAKAEAKQKAKDEAAAIGLAMEPKPLVAMSKDEKEEAMSEYEAEYEEANQKARMLIAETLNPVVTLEVAFYVHFKIPGYAVNPYGEAALRRKFAEAQLLQVENGQGKLLRDTIMSTLAKVDECKVTKTSPAVPDAEGQNGAGNVEVKMKQREHATSSGFQAGLETLSNAMNFKETREFVNASTRNLVGYDARGYGDFDGDDSKKGSIFALPKAQAQSGWRKYNERFGDEKDQYIIRRTEEEPGLFDYKKDPRQKWHEDRTETKNIYIQYAIPVGLTLRASCAQKFQPCSSSSEEEGCIDSDMASKTWKLLKYHVCDGDDLTQVMGCDGARFGPLMRGLTNKDGGTVSSMLDLDPRKAFCGLIHRSFESYSKLYREMMKMPNAVGNRLPTPTTPKEIFDEELIREPVDDIERLHRSDTNSIVSTTYFDARGQKEWEERKERELPFSDGVKNAAASLFRKNPVGTLNTLWSMKTHRIRSAIKIAVEQSSQMVLFYSALSGDKFLEDIFPDSLYILRRPEVKVSPFDMSASGTYKLVPEGGEGDEVRQGVLKYLEQHQMAEYQDLGFTDQLSEQSNETLGPQDQAQGTIQKSRVYWKGQFDELESTEKGGAWNEISSTSMTLKGKRLLRPSRIHYYLQGLLHFAEVAGEDLEGDGVAAKGQETKESVCVLEGKIIGKKTYCKRKAVIHKKTANDIFSAVEVMMSQVGMLELDMQRLEAAHVKCRDRDWKEEAGKEERDEKKKKEEAEKERQKILANNPIPKSGDKAQAPDHDPVCEPLPMLKLVLEKAQAEVQKSLEEFKKDIITTFQETSKMFKHGVDETTQVKPEIVSKYKEVRMKHLHPIERRFAQVVELKTATIENYRLPYRANDLPVLLANTPLQFLLEDMLEWSDKVMPIGLWMDLRNTAFRVQRVLEEFAGTKGNIEGLETNLKRCLTEDESVCDHLQSHDTVSSESDPKKQGKGLLDVLKSKISGMAAILTGECPEANPGTALTEDDQDMLSKARSAIVDTGSSQFHSKCAMIARSGMKLEDFERDCAKQDGKGKKKDKLERAKCEVLEDFKDCTPQEGKGKKKGKLDPAKCGKATEDLCSGCTGKDADKEHCPRSEDKASGCCVQGTATMHDWLSETEEPVDTQGVQGTQGSSGAKGDTRDGNGCYVLPEQQDEKEKQLAMLTRYVFQEGLNPVRTERQMDVTAGTFYSPANLKYITSLHKKEDKGKGKKKTQGGFCVSKEEFENWQKAQTTGSVGCVVKFLNKVFDKSPRCKEAYTKLQNSPVGDDAGKAQAQSEVAKAEQIG